MADVNDRVAQAKERRAKLMAQLAAAPVVDVLGVVRPSGVTGGKVGREDLWELGCTFVAWRLNDGELQTQPLSLNRQVTNAELLSIRKVLRPFSVVRIKARVLLDSLVGSPQALLEEAIGADTTDKELNDKAAELQKPVTFDDPLLGTFTLTRRVNWFIATTQWLGMSIMLNLAATEGAELQDALKTAYTLWENQEGWNKRVRDFAVQVLLPLKNDSWLDEGEAELMTDQFEARMKLESITVNSDGTFDFWHNDGYLFGGHSIQISGDLTKGPTRADIAG
jgi:hypothetical protein